MIKSFLLTLLTFMMCSAYSSAQARTSTYVLCYKQGKVAWSEEHYNPRSVQTAYYKCVSDNGTPQLVIS
ncbi:hypothetical protein [Pseudoalteromonas umbrosa]|uniref:hypothetical protein n=1 Tax=Pseudoalteromonas umbrosa TaxID=3048489 RepID=UPI0024C386A2|nr:hypothetical protein [Pseudoalteromonas sp. B95]MDK1286366.1 hypothetical protein [Pseudoalteromonas sp. B95]